MLRQWCLELINMIFSLWEGLVFGVLGLLIMESTVGGLIDGMMFCSVLTSLSIVSDKVR
jgi:hypothetical protein